MSQLAFPGQVGSTAGLPSYPPSPYSNPEEWNHVKIAGVTSPGLSKVGEFRRKWDWDEKRGKGRKGAKLSYLGFHLARGRIEFHLLDGPHPTLPGVFYQHLAQWYIFANLFQYDPTKQVITAVKIYHPSLAMIGVDSVICESISNPVEHEPGHYIVSVDLLEYTPDSIVNEVQSPTATKAATPTGPKAPPGAVQDPHDVAFQKQFAQQLAIAQAPP